MCWGGGSVGKVFAARVWQPESRSTELMSKLDKVGHASAFPVPQWGGRRWRQKSLLKLVGQDQYRCSCQDTMRFASYTKYTRLMSKANCPVKPSCFFDNEGNRQRNTKGPECFAAWRRALVSREQEDTLCLRSHGLFTWKTYEDTPLKAGRPSQLHGFRQTPKIVLWLPHAHCGCVHLNPLTQMYTHTHIPGALHITCLHLLIHFKSFPDDLQCKCYVNKCYSIQFEE